MTRNCQFCRELAITTAVEPSVSPPFVHSAAIECGLAQFDVDFVVDPAEPLGKLFLRWGLWGTFFEPEIEFI